MTRPRIALLDASGGNPHTPRNFRRELAASLAEFPVAEGELPATFDFDAVVVTGSRTSVYWDEPWIGAVAEWVAAALDRDIPALGICWGHQLLAHVLGGTVEPMGEYELGYRAVSHEGDPLFEGVPETFTVFTSHSDAVTSVPDGATVTARNDYGIHGFRDGTVFGVQAHPEYDAETAEWVVRQKDLPDEQIEAVCGGITPAAEASAQPAKQIFENFRSIVRDSRAEAAASR